MRKTIKLHIDSLEVLNAVMAVDKKQKERIEKEIAEGRIKAEGGHDVYLDIKQAVMDRYGSAFVKPLENLLSAEKQKISGAIAAQLQLYIKDSLWKEEYSSTGRLGYKLTPKFTAQIEEVIRNNVDKEIKRIIDKEVESFLSETKIRSRTVETLERLITTHMGPLMESKIEQVLADVNTLSRALKHDLLRLKNEKTTERKLTLDEL